MFAVRGTVVSLALAAAAASVTVLNDFRPSQHSSAYGKTSDIEFGTEIVELESGVLAHHLPRAMRDFAVGEPVWIIGYRSDILDATGKTPRENYLCHTFFGDQRVTQHDGEEIRGIYSDSFTPELRLPDGFGIPLKPDENLHWMPMFNNREEQSARVSMKVRLTVIRGKDLKKPLTPLYSALYSVHAPHLYFVPPGRHEQTTDFKPAFNGAIHFMGTHIHPHGVSVELFNVSRQERIWKGMRKLDGEGRMVGMEVFSSAEGVPIRAGETYRVSAVYENPTQAPIDAMAGLYVLYARH
jgi:hypothetical protein